MVARPANPNMRHEILVAAKSTVEKKGAEGLTMREIGDAIGYSATSIYMHFRSKEELLDSLITQLFDELEEHLLLAESATTSLEMFERRLRGYVEWGIRNPNPYRLMFETVFSPELLKDTPVELRERRARGLARMEELLACAHDEGLLDLRQGETRELALVSWMAAHGLVSLTISWRLFGIPDVMIPSAEVVEHALALTDAYLKNAIRNRPV